MLWVKAFHIIFMVCWFAGIFYLPRLFVNHAMTNNKAVHDQLCLMEKKLYRFITPFMYLTIGFGIWLTSFNWEYYLSSLWYQIKIALILLLIAYHFYCGVHLKKLAENDSDYSHVYFRWFNELPVLVLFSVVILAVLKPF